MAVLVVDLLEVIEVQHQHGTCAAMAAVVGHLPIHIDHETATVVQARERVVVDEILQLSDEMLALGDVLHLHDQRALEAAPQVLGFGGGDEPPGVVTIGMLEALLEGATVHRTTAQAADQVVADGDVVGMEQVCERQPWQ